MNQRLRIDYVLYSHYWKSDKGDFETFREWREANRTLSVTRFDFERLDAVKHLRRHIPDLCELLTTPGHSGMLVLFYAPGYESYLAKLAEVEGEHLVENERLRELEEEYSNAVADHVRGMLFQLQVDRRIRFLTFRDVDKVLRSVDRMTAEDIRSYLLGSEPGLRYDAPKIPEAILRLRLLGHGIPVFRIDHDALMTGYPVADTGLFRAIATAIRAYRFRTDSPSVSTFLYSVSYSNRAILYPKSNPKVTPFEAWGRAFATRLYPALALDKPVISNTLKQIKKIGDPSKGDGRVSADKCWDRCAEACFSKPLAEKFYAVQVGDGPATKCLRAVGNGGIGAIGAHPIHGVISGALLCLSDQAILDLPPFSNLSRNVMWIDDHLKYALHRAMGHLAPLESLHQERETGLESARIHDVSVLKARSPVGGLLSYVFERYLPTLLWGTIMDAWITSDSILNVPYLSLGPEDRDHWERAYRGEIDPRAPLPKALHEALSRGRFTDDPDDKNTPLKNELRDSAMRRINVVRHLWNDLKADGRCSFACSWALGTVKREIGPKAAETLTDPVWRGIPNTELSSENNLEYDSLNQSIKDGLEALIKDTCKYVNWTLYWPHFVQLVRQLRQGEFAGDLSWVSPP